MALDINDLRPHSPKRTLWDSLPMKTFIRISSLETFRSTTTELAVRVWSGVASLPLDDQDIGELTFGRLRLLTCGGVAAAYLIEAPRCRIVSVGNNYAAVSLREDPDVSDAHVLFSDGTLTLVGASTAWVAVISTFRWTRK